jgi:hypothetical protein
MATQADVRRIALALPSVTELKDRFAFEVMTPSGKGKGIAWVWLERIEPKKARVPNPKVLAVRVADQGEKAMLLAADPDKFFTEDHYNGYPAVMVRLANVTVPELRKLIGDAWRCQAPKSLLREPVAAKKPKSKRRRA